MPDEALAEAVLQIRNQARGRSLSAGALADLLRPWVKPNLVYEARLTRDLRAAAEKSIPPTMLKVRAGTTLMENREQITPQILEMLAAHEKRVSERFSRRDVFFKTAGNGMLLILVMLIGHGFMRLMAPRLLQDISALLLLVLLALGSLLAAKGLLYLSNPARLLAPWLLDLMVPVELAPLLATMLVNAPAALVLGLWNSFVVAILFENSFAEFTIGLTVTVVAVLLSRNVRKRSGVLRAGLGIGTSKVVLALALGALAQQPLPVLGFQSAAGLGGGVFSALMALWLIPLCEALFRRTTNISLLELSDMSQPLLQRLAMEAPGTYHHSLIIANLGQAAALEIGANDLLVRVCAYYHDIGKLAKPDFYAENTHLRENPHDELSPSMSALVILSHVKEGVNLVRRHKLPQPIVDAIEQHHGTGLITYFYQRALKLQAAEQEDGGRAPARAVLEDDFRYAGPKPQTPEMAILALADTVEAASRSLEKPTPMRLENMIRDLVLAKLRDGQLDECALTFAQLKAIRKSFVFTLTNMLHGRIAYLQDENKPPQSAVKVSDQPDEAPPPDAVVAGQDFTPSED